MKELIEELRAQYADNEILLSVLDSIQKAYAVGYSDGFAAGEEAMKNVVDKLMSPPMAN